MAIESIGAYIPRYRISAEEIEEAWDGSRVPGVREKRVAGADEDTVTMAVAALEDAIKGSSINRDEFCTLAVGTTTPPIDEGDFGVTIAEILGLDNGVEVIVYSQSTRAGTRALLSCLQADGPALAVASDGPRGAADNTIDHTAGAGAVAIVTGDGAVDIRETTTYVREYPGTRFRRRGSESVESYNATAFEREAYTTTIASAIDRLKSSTAALAPTAPDGNLAMRVGRVIDGGTVYHLADELGNTGTASPFFGLLKAWEDGEETVTVIGYGAGSGVDALVVEGSLSVEWRRPATDISYAAYLRKRGYVLNEGGDR